MKCFYHNDHDGRCAGATVAYFTGNYNGEDYFEIDHVTPIDISMVEDGEDVYIVDFGFSETELDNLHSLSTLVDKCNLIWIDHHTSSMKMCHWNDWMREIKGIRKEGISGAALTYMYLHQCEFEEIPYFVKLVSDYDCWQFKFDPHTTHFKLGMEMTDYDALDYIWIHMFDEEKRYCDFADHVNLNGVMGKGGLIKEYIDKDNDRYRDLWAYETEIAGYKCLVVNKSSNSWVFGEKYDEYPLVMVWVYDGETYKYSIYSGNPDVDCCAIAESYGGGGHKGAAGFRSKELLFKKVS